MGWNQCPNDAFNKAGERHTQRGGGGKRERERENAQANRLMWVLLWEVLKSSWESRQRQTTGCFVTDSICTTVTFAENRIRLALFKPAVFG